MGTASRQLGPGDHGPATRLGMCCGQETQQTLFHQVSSSGLETWGVGTEKHNHQVSSSGLETSGWGLV